jgi:hypothetical protein
MDISSIASSASSMAGGLLGDSAQKLAAVVGLSPEKVEELIAQAKGLVGDASLSAEALKTKLTTLATDHGVPANFVETAVSMVMGQVKPETAPAAPTPEITA